MKILHNVVLVFVLVPTFLSAAEVSTRIVPLDGEDWQIAKDSQNIGRNEGWFNAIRKDCQPIRVPWILESAFPDYDGVVWYYKTLRIPENPHANGRTLLRFWAVDFQADVWLNGKHLGGHEGSETPFTLDATDAAQPGQENLLVVRLLNPTETPIDGIRLNMTPRGLKTRPFRVGLGFNHGGILDSVELLLAPAARISDLFATANPKTGEIRVETTLLNAEDRPLTGKLEITVAPHRTGSTLCRLEQNVTLQHGENKAGTVLRIDNPRLWELNDPFLYRVTVSVETQEHPQSCDETSIKTGFREFVFQDGYFRLNGQRIFFRCSHTCNHTPIGLRIPHDKDLYRRDLINAKMMGFNAIRFIAGMPTRYQLDLADELGLMVYDECQAAWMTMEVTPRFAEWYDAAIREMILRDRNHPSVVIWGLLNESASDAVNSHAAKTLKLVRALDDTRMVLFNSGRWDLRQTGASGFPAGIACRRRSAQMEPFVGRNVSDKKIDILGIEWEPGRLATHPGPNGEYGVIRWIAPRDSQCTISATFDDITELKTTTDVHVLHNGKSLFAGGINIQGGGDRAQFQGSVPVKKGETLDFAVGQGNGNYGGDDDDGWHHLALLQPHH